jgi:UDP-2-acetamido-3-amino-2,3-dideoxy-glucuronate N-acetyltransferase
MIHPTAEIGEGTVIGAETDVWARTHLREGAVIGHSCRIGADVYIGVDVRVGDRCKVQNRALLYEGSIIEDEVFVGPAACLTNDRHPRASSQDGQLKDTSDWRLEGVLLRHGASIGAGAIVLPGVTVGRFALVGAGAVVTRSVPDHALVAGNPAAHLGWVCRCGQRLADLACPGCGRRYVPAGSGLEEGS